MSLRRPELDAERVANSTMPMIEEAAPMWPYERLYVWRWPMVDVHANHRLYVVRQWSITTMVEDGNKPCRKKD